MSQQERSRVFERDRIFLDVGAANRQDAEERLGIRPGDPIAPDSKFLPLNDGKLYVGKAWDDRVGLAVMIEVMRRLKQNPPPNSVYAVATVQEEIGLRGAHTSSFQVKPDIGLSIEVGVAADYPGSSQDEAQERLGSGPGIFLHDSSMLPNIKLRDFVGAWHATGASRCNSICSAVTARMDQRCSASTAAFRRPTLLSPHAICTITMAWFTATISTARWTW
jgi:endoglucanase